MRVVEILWGDAFIDTDDFDPKEAHATEPCFRYTVGYLIARNQYGYVLATDRYKDEDDGVSGKMFIPNDWVVKVTRLK